MTPTDNCCFRHWKWLSTQHLCIWYGFLLNPGVCEYFRCYSIITLKKNELNITFHFSPFQYCYAHKLDLSAFENYRKTFHLLHNTVDSLFLILPSTQFWDSPTFESNRENKKSQTWNFYSNLL